MSASTITYICSLQVLFGAKHFPLSTISVMSHVSLNLSMQAV